MPPVPTPAKHKKSSGMLTIDEDSDRLYWQGDNTLAPAVQLKLSDIENVQATPDTSPKLMIKLLMKTPGESYMFQFTSKTFQTSSKEKLSAIVRKNKGVVAPTEQAATPRQSSSDTTKSKTDAKSEAKAKAHNYSVYLEPKSLLRNHSLQQDVIRSNTEIRKTFEQAVISNNISNEDFWSTRLHVLRAAALSNTQKRGPYNVLSTIKRTVNSDNQQVLSLSVEKIQDLYEQYPIVYQAFKDNVPPMAENNFWEDFFSSRLFRRLRGDKLKPSDPMHPVLDKYLDYLDNYEKTMNNQTAFASASKKRKHGDIDQGDDDEEEVDIPFFLNIEGNEENDPQKLGNRPDMTMRSGAEGPSALTLLKSMNSLSQKMVYGQESSSTGNTSSSQGTGINRNVPMHDSDESSLISELRLRGLEDERTPQYKELKMKTLDSDAIRDDILKTHPELFGNDAETDTIPKGTPTDDPSADSMTPAESIQYLKKSISGPIDLQEVGSSEHSDAIKRAQKHIARTVKQRSKEGGGNRTSDERSTDNIVQEKVSAIHSTTVEYLRHFWLHFLSGDPAQAQSINKLASVLRKSQAAITEIENRENGTEYKSLVVAAMQPLYNSVTKALETYNKALAQFLATNESTRSSTPTSAA